jgi:hypothetical protein
MQVEATDREGRRGYGGSIGRCSGGGRILPILVVGSPSSLYTYRSNQSENELWIYLGLTGSSLCFEPIQQVGYCGGWPGTHPAINNSTGLAAQLLPAKFSFPCARALGKRIHPCRLPPRPPPLKPPSPSIYQLGMKSGGGFMLRRQNQTRELETQCYTQLSSLNCILCDNLAAIACTSSLRA